MSIIWRENVTCLFLKMNPLQFIHFCWVFLESQISGNFGDFLVTVSREGPLLWSTCWPHPVSRTFSSGMFPYCLCCRAYGWMSVWNGFDVDSHWGMFCMAGEPLEAMQQPQWGDAQAGHAHTDTYCIHVEMEAEECQYFTRQETGLQEVDMPGRIESAAPCNPDLSTPARLALLKILFIRDYLTVNDAIFCAEP